MSNNWITKLRLWEIKKIFSHDPARLNCQWGFPASSQLCYLHRLAVEAARLEHLWHLCFHEWCIAGSILNLTPWKLLKIQIDPLNFKVKIFFNISKTILTFFCYKYIRIDTFLLIVLNAWKLIHRVDLLPCVRLCVCAFCLCLTFFKFFADINCNNDLR